MKVTETTTPVFWTPKQNPTFLAENNPQTFARLATIKATKGQQIDKEIYLHLLTDRVQELINKADNPNEAATEIYNQMESAGLAQNPPTNAEEAATNLILDNWNLRENLHLIGLEVPKTTIEATQLKAATAFKETDWSGWLDALLVSVPRLSPM